VLDSRQDYKILFDEKDVMVKKIKKKNNTKIKKGESTYVRLFLSFAEGLCGTRES
jgi:hypothetical protein